MTNDVGQGDCIWQFKAFVLGIISIFVIGGGLVVSTVVSEIAEARVPDYITECIISGNTVTMRSRKGKTLVFGLNTIAAIEFGKDRLIIRYPGEGFRTRAFRTLLTECEHRR